MSSLPPLPPEWQAKADQNYAAAMTVLTAIVPTHRTDPKRNHADNADYHNTVAAMLLQWDAEAMKSDGAAITSLCAAAMIALADAGWEGPDRGEAPPGVDAEEPPKSARPRRRWDWRTVGFWAAMVYAAAVSVLAAVRLEHLN
jgi:hypothetical protein